MTPAAIIGAALAIAGFSASYLLKQPAALYACGIITGLGIAVLSQAMGAACS